MNKGFSLIELLISIGLLAIVVPLIVGVFFTNLAGQRKVNALSYIKDNGNYALLVMRKNIRNAKEIESCSSSSILITNPDGTQTTYSCMNNSLTVDGINLIPSDIWLEDSTCFQNCQTENHPPTVEINYTLTNRKESVLEKAEQEFEATVSLRTY